ncbi:MAG: zinc ribbon domain-containing protein [Oscillospiraceae bacterium]|nr:zinc ribbon domain-containing protein [Oscillospiraceae bacterium]
MICKKCGSECPDGNIFCEACGAELDAPVLPENVDDKGHMKKQAKPKKEKAPKPRKPKKEKKQRTAEEKAALAKKLKAGGICLALIAVIVIIVIITQLLGSNDGYNAAQKIPVGRNVAFAESETGLTFSEKSTNGMINNMTSFDYICISDKTTKVSGSEQPRWVILLTVGEDDIITAVEYYDFTQLKLNWKGRKMAEMLDQNSLDYGMSIKNVNKKLGLKPYYIKRTVSNDSTYCYRYFYTDPDEGYDRAYNYYVEFSDVEMAVKNVNYREINYAATILAAGEASPAAADSDPEAVSEENGEASEEDGSEEGSEE